MPPFDFDPINDGFWGNTTSTLDWCERNYEVNWYIAEFYNTVTNLAMVIPGGYGAYQVLRNNLEKRFLFSHLMLMIVGVGSTMFHMTLQYWGQMFDELPMVYSSCTFIYSLYMTRSKKGDNGGTVMIILIMFSLSFTVGYLMFPFPLILQVMYGLTVVVIVFLTLQLLLSSYQDRDNRIMWLSGLSVFLTAFILWNIDNQFCSHLQQFRDSKPSLLGSLSQLHGWWHILTGYATYMNIQFCLYNRQKFLKNNPTYSWDAMGVAVKTKTSKVA